MCVTTCHCIYKCVWCMCECVSYSPYVQSVGCLFSLLHPSSPLLYVSPIIPPSLCFSHHPSISLSLSHTVSCCSALCLCLTPHWSTHIVETLTKETLRHGQWNMYAVSCSVIGHKEKCPVIGQSLTTSSGS